MVENTALAAQMVAQSERPDVAALSSRFCGEHYGLNLLEPTSRTRTTTTPASSASPKSGDLPGADRTSLMMTLPHKPGALYNVLSKFYALGINLQKLESRPLPDREFEFMFYFDLECSVYAPRWSGCSGTWRRRASSSAIWAPTMRSSADGLRAHRPASWATAFPQTSTACWGTTTTGSSLEPPEEEVGSSCGGSFTGLNVTIPYKKTVMASRPRQSIGSVNTILRRPGRHPLLGTTPTTTGFCTC